MRACMLARVEPRILALETSALAGSLAACAGGRRLDERTLEPTQRSAQSLAPALRDLLQTVGWKPRDVQVVAVAVGPGSFTGLRVGVTTAKTFAYAVGAGVIGVNTLDCIARQAPETVTRLSAVIDAQRQQLYARRYARETASGVLVPVDEATIVEGSEWLAGLGEAAVSGPGREKWQARLLSETTVIDRAQWSPRAATVGLLAFERWERGERDDVWGLKPLYLRKSAAEEKVEGL